MKILLTGATGFLGSHLLESFLKSNYKTIILKRSSSNSWRINHLVNEFVSYDVDETEIDIIFEKEKPDIVVHTACSYGRKSESISSLLKNNLIF